VYVSTLVIVEKRKKYTQRSTVFVLAMGASVKTIVLTKHMKMRLRKNNGG